MGAISVAPASTGGRPVAAISASTDRCGSQRPGHTCCRCWCGIARIDDDRGVVRGSCTALNEAILMPSSTSRCIPPHYRRRTRGRWHSAREQPCIESGLGIAAEICTLLGAEGAAVAARSLHDEDAADVVAERIGAARRVGLIEVTRKASRAPVTEVPPNCWKVTRLLTIPGVWPLSAGHEGKIEASGAAQQSQRVLGARACSVVDRAHSQPSCWSP